MKRRLLIDTKPPKTYAEFDQVAGCPACCRRDKSAEFFVCSVCWPRVPAKDRIQLNAMRLRGQDCRSKLACVVRKLAASGGGPVDPIFR